MSSEARIDASRANGAKSRGPVTEEGKQASSRNSTRHGLLSKKIVLEGESQEEFDELLASYLEEHQPATPTERTLIESMAAARWRQERIWSLETAGMDHQIRNPRYFEGEDYPTQQFVAFRTLADNTRTLDLFSRYEARFERQFRTSLAAFLSLRAKRKSFAAPAKPLTTPLGTDNLSANPQSDREPEPAGSGSFGIPASEPESADSAGQSVTKMVFSHQRVSEPFLRAGAQLTLLPPTSFRTTHTIPSSSIEPKTMADRPIAPLSLSIARGR